MVRINNFLLKNCNFKYFQRFILKNLNLNNEEFFKKSNKNLILFDFKNLNLKKINLNSKCVNIFYF